METAAVSLKQPKPETAEAGNSRSRKRSKPETAENGNSRGRVCGCFVNYKGAVPVKSACIYLLFTKKRAGKIFGADKTERTV